jgi:hypothetical protein
VASAAGGGIHDGRGDWCVGQMSDNGAASTTHGVRCTLTLHDIGTTRNGTGLLQLLLADFALGKEAQKLTNSGLGLLSGRLDLGRELGETTGNAASGQDADSDALTNKNKNDLKSMIIIINVYTT